MSNPPNRNPAFQAAVKRMLANPPRAKAAGKKVAKKAGRKAAAR